MVKDLILTAENEPHWLLVCLLGVGVVFVGLAIIIGLVELMNWATNRVESKVKTEAKADKPSNVPSAPVSNGVIENRDELVAAICAAVAEENGTDISAIRVVSLKKL